MHSIEYDPIHDEIIVPQDFAQAILFFRGSANGEEKPVRIIHGKRTQLMAPERLAIDTVHSEIFVPDIRRILVFPLRGHGDIAPLRAIKILGGAAAKTIDVDPIHNLIVSGTGGGNPELLLLNRTDQGKSRPIGCIGGPKTGLTRINNIRVFPEKGWILVAQDGMEYKTGLPKPVGNPSFVAVFHITDRGNVSPRWTIGGPNGMLKKPHAIALDPEHKTIIVTDKYLNAVLTYSLPELFE